MLPKLIVNKCIAYNINIETCKPLLIADTCYHPRKPGFRGIRVGKFCKKYTKMTSPC